VIRFRDIDLSDPAELPAFFVNVVLQVEEVLSGLNVLQDDQVSQANNTRSGEILTLLGAIWHNLGAFFCISKGRLHLTN
jgi:hypothetical protein